jgi:hypothetical protein
VKIFPDATFFICFIEDIEEPETCIAIVKQYSTQVVGVVATEVLRTNRADQVLSHTTVWNSGPIKLGESVRPFLTKHQQERGEHELIAAAWAVAQTGEEILVILDDGDARSFVSSRLPLLREKMCGTVKFVQVSSTDHGKIERNDALRVLQKIRSSKFRCPVEVIATAEAQVRGDIDN